MLRLSLNSSQASSTPQHERRQFLDFLRRRGLRVTGERVALFEEIFAQHRHIDADELLAMVRDRGVAISRATVYRNLDLLVHCGLVRKQRLGKGRWRYEHLHAGQEHDHLICAGCGRVVEFQSAGIVALQTEICRAHGFDPREHALQILGRCLDCAPGAPAAPAAPARTGTQRTEATRV